MIKQNTDLLTVAEEGVYDAAMELRGKIDQYAARAEERHQETIMIINQKSSATNNLVDVFVGLPGS